MQDKNYREYFNYYLELERDFFSTEPYVTVEKENFDTFSVQYNRMYQSICSEIDCLLKELCKQLEGESKAGKIGAYCKVIQKYFKYFNNETVYFHKSRIELEPWKNWSDINAPTWWTMYNKVKHHRMETDSATKRQYYKFANLENVLNALAALYIVEEYYVYSYNYSKEKFDLSKTKIKYHPHRVWQQCQPFFFAFSFHICRHVQRHGSPCRSLCQKPTSGDMDDECGKEKTQAERYPQQPL